MKTIRQLAGQFSLSRSTLLYYDRLGLLRPEYRTSAGHRLYSAEDEARLARICELRAAGLPLGEIDAVLEPSRTLRAPLGDALNRRLTDLNREIAALRRQQQVAVALLRDQTAGKRSRIMTKERWIQLLTASGLDENDRARWHQEFERLSPEAHQDFLESLGLPAAEVAAIRQWSATSAQPSPARPTRPRRTKQSVAPTTCSIAARPSQRTATAPRIPSVVNAPPRPTRKPRS